MPPSELLHLFPHKLNCAPDPRHSGSTPSARWQREGGGEWQLRQAKTQSIRSHYVTSRVGETCLRNLTSGSMYRINVFYEQGLSPGKVVVFPDVNMEKWMWQGSLSHMAAMQRDFPTRLPIGGERSMRRLLASNSDHMWPENNHGSLS